MYKQVLHIKEGDSFMGNFIVSLKDEMNVRTLFTIPVFGGLKVAESTVGCWVVMAVMIIAAFILGRNLRVSNISKRQAFAEFLVTKLESIVGNIIGPKGTDYVPYLCTVMVYIALMNITGMFGMKSPTKDLNVTISLALMTIILVQIAGIQKKGVKGWLHTYVEPSPVVTPINILEIAIKPTSLCLRLFGNVLGSFIIMTMIELVVPVLVPEIFSLYFDVFDGFLQAYVFTFLSAMYINEIIE